MGRYSKWVDVGQRVQAITGPGDLYAEGTVVAYCDAPSVTIRKDDGTAIHWRADMCRETTKPCGAIQNDTGLTCTRPVGHADWHNSADDDLQIQWPTDHRFVTTAPKVFDDKAGAS